MGENRGNKISQEILIVETVVDTWGCLSKFKLL